MKTVFYIFIIILALAVLGGIFRACSFAGKMVNNGINTAYQQFKPEELLRKYEWFKDASAQCEAKSADLQVYEQRFADLKSSYGADSLKRRNWARDDVDQWNIWQSEYTGIKASYNDLASQYNAAMAKFNYAFCNKGSMPDGSMQPLPREYKPYINN